MNQGGNLERLLSALRTVCDVPGQQLPLDTPLNSLDGWDSMRAVNFQLELESTFSIDLSDAEITGSTTWAEVIELVESRGVRILPVSA
jgi:acyl carrier protein